MRVKTEREGKNQKEEIRVEVVHSVRDLSRPINDDGKAEILALPNDLIESAPRSKLHHQEVLPLLDAEPFELDDIGVLSKRAAFKGICRGLC